jgi:hypothetical protein
MLPLAGTTLAGESSTSRFAIMPFDVDGAALRLFSIAQSDRGHVPESAVQTAGLPTLRSTGFALVETTRQAEHEARVARARDRNTPAKLVGSPLTAENLVAGYRVDVLDKGQWRSLCQRRVRYTVGGIRIGHEAGQPGLLEEGYVRIDSATTGTRATDALYIHQTVARWDGWSLVVPRPDRVANPIVGSEPAQSFAVEVDLEPGSFPRLRFGREYQLRVRLADLAGGGLRRDQPGAGEEASRKFTHRRFEPLLAPELVPTAAYVDGASQERMVIRSDRGTSAAAYAAAHGYLATDLRYLFPAKSSLELAMQHPGTFDKALGPGVAPNEVRRQFNVAVRADKDVRDVDRATLTDGANSVKYFVIPESFPSVPWLADPGSRWIAVRVGSRPIDPETGNSGVTKGFDRTLSVWQGTWPDRVPIALRVEAAAAGCTARRSLSGDQCTFTIALGPAQQITVNIVSCPDINDVYPLLGVAYWAGASPTDPKHPVTNSIYRGANPLVTPPRTVTMVHAVQRPLKDPGGWFVAKREMGGTGARLDPSAFSIDVPSTGRLDLRAEWSDIEDVPPALPKKNTVVANVGSFDVAHKPPLLPPPRGAFPEIHHEFGDPRRRKVRYTVTAISRFSDYFDRILAQDPGACTVTATLDVTDVPSAIRPPAPAVRYVVPTFRWSRSGEGTDLIRSSRRGGGLRVLLERPWFVTGVDEALAVVAWPQASTNPTARERRHISLAGQDPLWTTATPAAIVNETHVRAAAAETVTLSELGKPVMAMINPLDLQANFDRDADCWFADLDLSPLAGASYFPFVRLALCRYQDNTADRGQRLSPPIQTEPLQLFPHRDLTVTREPGRARVVVSGTGPTGPPFTAIRAELQVFTGDPRAARDGLIGPSGWTVLNQATGRLNDNLNLDVPQTERRPLRIAVTEAESYPATTGPANRIVYADVITLPSST